MVEKNGGLPNSDAGKDGLFEAARNNAASIVKYLLRVSRYEEAVAFHAVRSGNLNSLKVLEKHLGDRFNPNTVIEYNGLRYPLVGWAVVWREAYPYH